MSPSDRLALALRRRRYLVSRWLPRAWLFTVVTAVAAAPLGLLTASLIAQPLASLPWFAWLLSVALLLSPVLARLDRRRVRLLGDAQISDPHAPTELGGLRRVMFRLREPATWREVAYVVVAIPIGWGGAAVHIAALWCVILAVQAPGYWINGGPFWIEDPAGSVLGFIGALLAIPAAGYVVGLLALLQAGLARSLLAPRGAELQRQIAHLTASRTRLVRSFEGDLRRIERDLHDGVQQKLVTLTIALGSVDLDVGDLAQTGVDVTGLRGRVDWARDLAESALEDLRTTVRAIHPRVLADHGLTAAVHELTSRMPIPVTLTSTVEERFDAEVELCAYFVVSEALTNIARHSRARVARVDVARIDVGRVERAQSGGSGDGGSGDGGARPGSAREALVREGLVRDGGAQGSGVLSVRVHDDGVGGASFGSGTGLVGLRERAEAAQGHLTVTSPAGGPTTIALLLPARAPRSAPVAVSPAASSPAAPSDTAPPSAVPSSAVPSSAVPSAVPSNAAPAPGAPSDTAPSSPVPPASTEVV